MIVALAFCSKDGHLAVKNLNFCLHVDGIVPVDALLTYDDATPPVLVAKVRDLAKRYFRSVAEHQYYAPQGGGWPQAANHAFQMTARHICTEVKQPFLWWEADAVPLRKGWLTDIVAEYDKALAAGKAFMGHHVQGIIAGGHMNGVGVYPADVGRYSRNAMLALNSAWDVSMSQQMMGHLWAANGLFQHCWATDPAGSPTNGAGQIPSFKSWEDVATGPHRADFRCALYHRCKDGSLIDQYMAQVAATAVPKHRSTAAALAYMPGGPGVKAGTAARNKKKKALAHDCRILIVTYHQDFQWLHYCLKGIEKFGKGFSGVTVAIPVDDVETYESEIGDREGVKLHKYKEVKGKGMLQHMERMANANDICKSDFVLHLDADCIAKKPFSVNDYIDDDGKPYYVVRSYQSLISETGVVSDCYQWKPVAERALGEEISIYSMCRHPTCFPRAFYNRFREHVEKVHKRPFLEFVLDGRNTFPQTFADFPTMGAWAWTHMHDKFHWIVLDNEPAPEDLFKVYWSHSGVNVIPNGSTMTPKAEMEAMLK